MTETGYPGQPEVPPMPDTASPATEAGRRLLEAFSINERDENGVSIGHVLRDDPVPLVLDIEAEARSVPTRPLLDRLALYLSESVEPPFYPGGTTEAFREYLSLPDLGGVDEGFARRNITRLLEEGQPVPTRPEPLTVERLTAALVKVGGLHRYTWEEYATAIIAALDMTADPVERAVESLNRAGEGQFTDHDLAVAVSGEEGSEARCTCGHLESEHLDHQDACIHSVIDFLERAVERIEAGETVHGSVVGCSCERFIPDTAQRSGGE